MEYNIIHYTDCLDFLKLVDDNTMDLTITSPPYNLNLRVLKGQYTKLPTDSCMLRTKYKNGYSDSLTMGEYFEWQKTVISELIRVTKKYVFYNVQMVAGNKTALFKLIGYFAEYLKEVIIWDKVNSQPAIGQRCLNSSFEFILVFSKIESAMYRQFEHANFERGTLDNLWHISTFNKKSNGVNTATFPDQLVKLILENFSNIGDLIFDPFIGSGTVAVNSAKMNRKYIGCEINTDYSPTIESKIQLNNYTTDLF